MPIEDGFWIDLPDDLSPLSIRELFSRVFPVDPSLQQLFLERLDVSGNPDLPDMYDALVEIFVREELGLCNVETHVNHGPEVDDSTVVNQRLTTNDTPPVLDLVLEQRFSAIDYAVRRGDFADQEEVLAWMRSRVLLYFLDSPDYVFLPPDPIDDDADTALLPIAQTLVDEGLIERPTESETIRGHRTGHGSASRNDGRGRKMCSNATRCSPNVLYDPETGECEFVTGVGDRPTHTRIRGGGRKPRASRPARRVVRRGVRSNVRRLATRRFTTASSSRRCFCRW